MSRIDDALRSHAGKRTLARAMVKPMLVGFPYVSNKEDSRDCEDCGCWEMCSDTKDSHPRDCGGSVIAECWRPRGCLLVWDI
jgi:hypothetical protein